MQLYWTWPKGECGPLEKPLPVYFMGDIAEEVAQETYKKLIDKSEYDKLMELKNQNISTGIMLLIWTLLMNLYVR